MNEVENANHVSMRHHKWQNIKWEEQNYYLAYSRSQNSVIWYKLIWWPVILCITLANHCLLDNNMLLSVYVQPLMTPHYRTGDAFDVYYNNIIQSTWKCKFMRNLSFTVVHFASFFCIQLKYIFTTADLYFLRLQSC